MERQKEKSGLVAIFDVDNTLIDSDSKLRREVADAMIRCGVKIEPDEVKGDWYKLAESYNVKRDDFDKELDKRKSWEQALRDGDVPLFSDTYSCLDRLQNSGVSLGILTRSTPEYTKAKIDYHGLNRYFGDRIAVTPIQNKDKTSEALELVRKLKRGRDAQQVYFIGDKPEDVVVAEAIREQLGISANGIYINRKRVAVPEEIRKYRIVDSLHEVPEIILGGQNGR